MDGTSIRHTKKDDELLTEEEWNNPETFLLLLPSDVAKLGREGMRLSCTTMKKRMGGVLEPFLCMY